MSKAALHMPEPIEHDLERFLVHDKRELVSILRRMATENVSVSVHWDEGAGLALTMLLAVNPDFEEMVFDCANDPDSNRRLLRADRLTLIAMVDGVKVQFSARHVEPTCWEGRPALRMRLPDLLLRLQRREYFRVPVPLLCQCAIEDEGKVRVLELRVADLSLGGVALASERAALNLEIGDELENCRIGMGRLGTLHVNLLVRNVIESETRSGQKHVRLGCTFTNLSRASENLVARYIAQIERERRS